MNSPRQVDTRPTSWSAFPELTPPADGVRVRTNRTRKGVVPPETQVEKPIAPSTSHVRSATLSFTNMSDHGDLLVRYMRARKAVFIDALKWDLPNTEGMEFDQYDTPQCKWVVIYAFGEVLAGFRLMPTTAKCGIYTYMLADAQRGILADIPTDVLFLDAPIDEYVWEASRLFISDSVPSQMRTEVQSLLMNQMISVPQEHGVRNVIGIVPNVFSRWLRKLGLGAVPIGPKFSIDRVTSQAALFKVGQSVN